MVKNTTSNHMNNTVVAINIVHKKTNLLLSNCVPIFFDWNTNTDIIDAIRNDNEFVEYLNKIIFNIDTYSYATLYLGYYVEDDGTYKEQYIDIQDLFSLEDLETKNINLSDQYLTVIYKDLYVKALNKVYVNDVSDSELINDIHDQIHNKYGDQFSILTETKYVHSILTKQYELNISGINFIIAKLKKILQIHDE